MFRTCPYCHAHLDPGEHCDCDGIPEPELQAAQIGRRKAYPELMVDDEILDAYTSYTGRRMIDI